MTGREARTLPPTVVRGLFWRIYAALLWDPDLVTAANIELPPGSPMKVLVAKGEAVKALAGIRSILFPENEDD